MRLLVYEHVCAVGFGERNVRPSVLCEGFGMVRAIVADAKQAGFCVTTALNSQMAEFNLPFNSDHYVLVRSNTEAIDVLEKAADFADAALVIAPETSGTLQYLVRRIEQQNDLLSLNSTADAIIEASDKTLLEEKAKKIGVETPKTIFFRADEDIENVAVSVEKNLGIPAVIKPSDGVGCEGLSIVYNKKQLLNSVKKTAKLKTNFFIAQEFVCGKPASVTLISNGKIALPITLNKQNVSLRPPGRDSTYNGGIIPFDEKGMQDTAFEAAKRIVESISGLKGYIGVDLILTEHGPVLIEINPRLTTSYIGVQKVSGFNLAKAMIDSAKGKDLPTVPEPIGSAYLGKVKVTKPTKLALQQTFALPALFSPPFSYPDQKYAYALICSKGPTVRQAKGGFNKAKEQLQNMLCLRGTD